MTPAGVPRPQLLVFVAGTATDVGKTWWTARVAEMLRATGISVAARKPVQSGDDTEPSDCAVLAAATGEDPRMVCPPHRSYPLAWAPPMAARELGLPAFSVADLAAETVWAEGTQVGVVEGVGGPRSPIASDGDNVDLARALEPDLVVLVADAGLGAINAVRLAAPAFAAFPVIVAFNRYEDNGLPRHNRSLLATEGFDIVTSPAALAPRLISAERMAP